MRLVLLAIALALGAAVVAPPASASHPCHVDDPACMDDDHDPLCRRGVPDPVRGVVCALP